MPATDKPAPSPRDPLEDSTAVVPTDGDGGDEVFGARTRLQVTVVGRAHVATVMLPGAGVFLIGRGHDCAIRIDDPSISRRHAALHVARGLRIEDLGSVNGTRLRGRALAVGALSELALGETVGVGSTTVVVQERTPALSTRRTPEPELPCAADVVVLDPAMVELYALARRVGPADISVLVLGETGAGKDVYAEQLHRSSPRASKPFLQLNCAGLSDAILDSELFGHERGAFTGAVVAKPGLLETADGGTVFLDEIGDMPLSTQAKLLRVLEDGKVRRVGGLTSKPIDVRFIAATNRDLEAAIEAGQFRQDLFFRLNGVTVVIPPLRRRPLEIEPLARMFARRAATQAGRPAPLITDEALALLQGFSWPGNVRQLKNTIVRAALLSTTDAIECDALRAELLAPRARGTDAVPPLVPEMSALQASGLVARRPQRGPEEAAWIQRALDVANGNRTVAAKLLGISRRTLISRIAEYGFAPRR